MASISTLVDLVKIQCLSSGTGAFSLGPAVPGYRGVEALVDGATYSYSVQQDSRYEVGTGVYLADTQTLVRTPSVSSNGNAAVAFAANAQITFTARAEDLEATGGTFPIVQTTGNNPDVAMSQNITTEALNALDAALQVGGEFIQGGTGAVSRTGENKARERVSVADFGAVGDGSTDDAPAINAAILYASAIGGADIFFEQKIYAIGATIDVKYPNVRLVGTGHPNFQDSGVLPLRTTLKATSAITMAKIRTPYASEQGLPAVQCNKFVGAGMLGIAFQGNETATKALEIDSVSFIDVDVYATGIVGGPFVYEVKCGISGTDLGEACDVQQSRMSFRARQTDTTAQKAVGILKLSGSINANVSLNRGPLYGIQVLAQHWNGDCLDVASADNNDITVNGVRPGGTGRLVVCRGGNASTPVGGESNNFAYVAGAGAIYAEGTDTPGVTSAPVNVITHLDTGNGTPLPTGGTGVQWKYTQNDNVTFGEAFGRTAMAVDVATAKAQRALLGNTTQRVYNASSDHQRLADQFGNEWGVNIDGATGDLRILRLGGSGKIASDFLRPRLQGNLTYYVRTDGNDGNTGLADSAGGALATWEAAVAKALSWDFNGHDITIRAGAESGVKTWNLAGAGGINIHTMTGYGRLVFQGNGANTVINGAVDQAFSLYNTTNVVSFGNLRINSTGGYGSIVVGDGSSITFEAVGPIFGAAGPNSAHIMCHDTRANATIVNSTYSIVGGAGVAHLWAAGGGIIFQEGCTVTLTGTPAFGQFAMVSNNGIVQATGSTFTGAATGLRFYAQGGGVINTLGNGASYFPGNAVGGVATGGVYIDTGASAFSSINGKSIVPWTDFTPTVTSETGTITSGAVQSAKYKREFDRVDVEMVYLVTTKGTAGAGLKTTLPVAPAGSFTGAASWGAGATGVGGILGNFGGTNAAVVIKTDGTTPFIADNQYFLLSFSYRV